LHGRRLNGGPALFACKPMLLLIGNLLQHQLEFIAMAAWKPANFVVIIIHVLRDCYKLIAH
jgi:hypothetical protein